MSTQSPKQYKKQNNMATHLAKHIKQSPTQYNFFLKRCMTCKKQSLTQQQITKKDNNTRNSTKQPPTQYNKYIKYVKW